MKHTIYRIGLVAATLAALAVTGPARAGQKAGQQLSFTCSSSGIATVVDVSLPIVTVSLSGRGEATHLGHFTESATVYVDTSIDPEHGGKPSGTWTLTLGNRDQLFMVFAPTSHGLDDTHGQGDFIIVGGTGRLQGATGFCEQIVTFPEGRATAPTFPYINQATGVIFLPASTR